MREILFEKKFKALGTDICIWIIAPRESENEIALIFDKVEDIYREKDLILSRFNPASELSKLNDNLGKYFEVSPDIIYLAQKSIEYYLKSDKVFDPRILDELEKIGYRKNFQDNVFDIQGDFSDEIFNKDLREDLIIENNQIKFVERMDFSGIAKGYITDKIASFIFSNGWRNFLVDSGGDMYASGLNKQGEKWGIALEEFKNENEILADISNEGIATSGNTRKYWTIGEKRFHHLINPKDANQFVFDLKSVTVVARTTQEADVMAKVLFIMGLEKGLDFAKNNKIKSIFLKNDKEIIKSNSLD